MGKIAYIIPGFDCNGHEVYRKIANDFRKRGFRAQIIKLHWKNRVMTDYVNEFLDKIKISKGDKVYLVGFSFGSMVALIASEKIRPQSLILCSLSPYFKEDLHKIKKSIFRWVGKRRLEDHKNYSFDQIAKSCTAKVILFRGEEMKPLMERVEDASKKLKNSKLIVVPNAIHDIRRPEYYGAVSSYIKKLK